MTHFLKLNASNHLNSATAAHSLDSNAYELLLSENNPPIRAALCSWPASHNNTVETLDASNYFVNRRFYRNSARVLKQYY